jgi:hypothetical protein
MEVNYTDLQGTATYIYTYSHMYSTKAFSRILGLTKLIRRNPYFIIGDYNIKHVRIPICEKMVKTILVTGRGGPYG